MFSAASLPSRDIADAIQTALFQLRQFFAIFPNSQDVHTYHHLGMWALVVFSLVHIYAAVREDIVSRQSIISSMVSGERNFKDEAPE